MIDQNGVIKTVPAIAQKCSKLAPGQYMFEVYRYDQRTDKQNRYIHGGIIPWFNEQMREFGNIWTNEQAKLQLKEYVGWGEYYTVSGPNGKPVRRFAPWTTHDQSKKKFSLFIDLVRSWCIDKLGCEPPPPPSELREQ